jgi:hypothetical protein
VDRSLEIDRAEDRDEACADEFPDESIAEEAPGAMLTRG